MERAAHLTTPSNYASGRSNWLDLTFPVLGRLHQGRPEIGRQSLPLVLHGPLNTRSQAQLQRRVTNSRCLNLTKAAKAGPASSIVTHTHEPTSTMTNLSSFTDVVYVGVIQVHHLAVASMMLKAGKHVLCEKPLCMNVQETKQLIDLARENKVFLMEAVWSRFFPVYREMMKRIAAGEIGDVVQVIASFGKAAEHVERLVRKDTGGGATLDMGIYTVQFATLVMGGDKPLNVLAGGHLNKEGVDVVASASLVYPKGRTASLSTTIRADLPSEAFVVGTKGTIKVSYPMWCPESFESPSGTYTAPLPVTGQTYNFNNSQGLMYEAAEVRRCINAGLLESPGMSHGESITIAEVMEQMRAQMGVI